MSEQLLTTPCTFGENGNFLLERELGSGGMGGVYMGRDKMLDRPVAVKVMLKEYGADAEFVGKFKKEAQAAAKLIHPNIAQIYSYGISGGMPYIAMELVAGGSLWTVMQASGGKTDVTRVLKICQQVAQALQCSTDQGFVHGDIKPENILLDANGNAKLVDFGLAGMQKDTSEIWGTPYYIAPEKVRQEGVDFRADMYNLGGTLYHALTNVPPFEGDDVAAVVKARFLAVPKKPSEIRPDLTPAVDALVMRMLEQDKNSRFPSFEALIEEFKRVLTTGLENKAAPETPNAAAGTAKRPAPAAKGGRRMTTVRRRPTAASVKTEDPDIDNQKDEDEEGGNLGVKVAGFIIGGIVLIGLVIGGLVWFKVASKNADEERLHAGYASKVGEARKSIAATRDAAVKYADQFDEFAGKATKASKGSTSELKKLYSDWAEKASQSTADEMKKIEQMKLEIANLLEEMKPSDDRDAMNKLFADWSGKAEQLMAGEKKKLGLKDCLSVWSAELPPPPSKELLAAIASTNEAAVAAANGTAATNAAPAAAAAAMAAGDAAAQMGAAMEKMVKAMEAGLDKAMPAMLAQLAKQVGMPPPPTDFDPKSPEADDYLKQLQTALEKAKAEGKFKVPGKAEEPVAAETPAEPAMQRPPELDAMRDVWDRAYSCQASAIKIRHKLLLLVKECDSADEVKGDDKATAEKLAAMSVAVKDKCDTIRGSKDVENVRKGITFVEQKGGNAVKNAKVRLMREGLAAQKLWNDANTAGSDLRRHVQEKLNKQRLIETEQQAAKAKFDSFASSGMLAQLDWDRALSQLKALKAECKSVEGGFAVDHEMRKVEAMKMVQDIFKENLPGYVFKKSKLKGNKVRKIDATMIDTVKADGKTPQKLSWNKFYKEYTGNLNELINTFVVKGRENGKKKLNLKDWANAMSGAALSMRIICAEAAGAVEYGEKLVKDVAAAYPDYVKNLKAMFPDIDFEKTADATE